MLLKTEEIMEYFKILIETMGIHYFYDPNDRIYFVYILSALLMTAIYFLYQFKKIQVKKILFYFFNFKVLFHASSRVDIYLYLSNYWIRFFLIVPIIFSEVKIIEEIKWSLGFYMPTYAPITLNPLFYSIVYSLIFLLVSDFFRFYFHYLTHKIPLLWELHKVHHSAQVLTPLTTYRVHPVEVLLLIIKQIFVTSLVAGFFSFFIAGEYEFVTIFGIQLTVIIINMSGANLRHSHVPISFGKFLETIFISPIMHQKHHAINQNQNLVNLGSFFAFWDILFHTHQRPDFKPMRFGLPKSQREKKLYNLLINPFLNFQKIKKPKILAGKIIVKSQRLKYLKLKFHL